MLSGDGDDLLSWFKDSLSQPELMEPKFWIDHVTKTDLAERHVALLGCLQVMVWQSRQPMLAFFFCWRIACEISDRLFMCSNYL